MTVFVVRHEGEDFEALYRRKQRFTPNHELRREKIRKAKRNRARRRGRGSE